MKSLKVTCAVLGLSLLSALPMLAESAIRVNVPYQFIAGKVRLPAGTYTIQEDAVNGVLTISNTEGRTVAMLSGPGNTAGTAAPSLTFVNVKGEMVLTSVQQPDRPARTLPTQLALK
ncbi:MAG TPA: hypothetical protein VMJ34_00205 [Bryobacteraceae bacterium]|nr:hypothetical protein [Bryobacteraceae bacterium]